MTVAATIGTDMDYGTPALWEASIPADATEPYVGTIMVNEAYTGGVNYNVDNNGSDVNHTLQVHASVRHNGTPGSGARVVTATTAFCFIINSTGNFILDGLELLQTGSGTQTGALRCSLVSGTTTVKNCLIRKTGAEQAMTLTDDENGAIFNSEGNLYIKEGSSAHHVVDIGIMDLSSLSTFNFTNDTIVDAGGNAGTAGLRINDSNATFNVNNVESYGAAAGCFLASAGAFTGNKNRSSDATAPGATNWRNATALDHLVSVTAGSFDLRRPAAYSSYHYAGDQLADTLDFEGDTRLAGKIPIGADYEAIGATAPSTAGNTGLGLGLGLGL